MLLQDILYTISIKEVVGTTNLSVSGIQIDSRLVVQDSVFVALSGHAADGKQFIAPAIANGAIAVVCDALPEVLQEQVTYLVVADTAIAAGVMAHQFYGRPSEKLQLVGVTGTNGKTTVATLLYKLFTKLGYTCGLISTVENMIGATVSPATHTTPDAVNLNKLLAEMAAAGCAYVFMEVSSHAVHQHRIAGLQFAGALFSNITHDHLDYHKTFDEYIKVKKQFFDDLPKTAFALTNVDDKRGAVMLQNTVAAKRTYSLKSVSDFKAKILDNGIDGLHMLIDEQDVFFKLIGEFNAYNLLAVYGAAIMLGQNREEVLLALSSISGAPGRFDYIISPKDKVMAIVDYAHTPDALLNVLSTINKLKKGFEQVITVVGCGGNRDATKRPVMAEVAVDKSDKVIFTSDNPRNEDPAKIIADMEAGVPPAGRRKYLSIADRKEAIKTAITLATPNDIVLVAGKGHENYQEINGVKSHFDDKEIVADFFKLLDK